MNTNDTPQLMNYDPNLTLCGRMATQQVKLTFGTWEYRAEMIVPVNGNTTGMSVIKAAVDFAYDKLPFETYEGVDVAYLTLHRASDGAELRQDDEDDGCEDWLADMCIGAEIISITPQPDEDEQDAAIAKSRENEPTEEFKTEEPK